MPHLLARPHKSFQPSQHITIHTPCPQIRAGARARGQGSSGGISQGREGFGFQGRVPRRSSHQQPQRSPSLAIRTQATLAPPASIWPVRSKGGVGEKRPGLLPTPTPTPIPGPICPSLGLSSLHLSTSRLPIPPVTGKGKTWPSPPRTA